MMHSRREIYRPRDLLHDVQGDVDMVTVLTILDQHRVVLGIRSTGRLRARRLGERTLHPDLVQLIARHEDTLLAVVTAHRAGEAKA